MAKSQAYRIDVVQGTDEYRPHIYLKIPKHEDGGGIISNHVFALYPNAIDYGITEISPSAYREVHLMQVHAKLFHASALMESLQSNAELGGRAASAEM